MRKKKEASDESAFTEAAPPKRLTPTDIQEKVFRQAFRGYDEKDVDEFLDRVTEELARVFTENKRLREELTRRPTVPVQVPAAAAAATGAGSEADDAADAGPIREVASSFITRERNFLRSLAGLIQEHAESVKDDVRRVRDTAQPAPPPGASQPAAEPVPAVPATGSSNQPSASPAGEAASDAPVLTRAPVADTQLPAEDPAPIQAQARQEEAVSAAPPPAPVASPAPEPARARAQTSAPASEAEDQTIRELFWGEE